MTCPSLLLLCLCLLLLLSAITATSVNAFSSIKSRTSSSSSPRVDDRPKLILSLVTARERANLLPLVCRLRWIRAFSNNKSFERHAALGHAELYGSRQTFCQPCIEARSYCTVCSDLRGWFQRPRHELDADVHQDCISLQQHSVEALVHERIYRGVSLVVQGAHLVPYNALIQKWNESGGVAVGIMLQVSEEEAHTSPCWCVEASRQARAKKKNGTRLNESAPFKTKGVSRLAKEADWWIVEQNCNSINFNWDCEDHRPSLDLRLGLEEI
jgi:hypothetical protein